MPQSKFGLSFAEPETARCPFAAYSELRPAHPVYRDPGTGIFEILGVAEIKQAAADTETFSCRHDRQSHHGDEIREAIKELYRTTGFEPVPTLLNNDGEDHHRLRSLVDRAFTVSRINALMPTIRSEVDQLIDDCEAKGEFEFITDFAIPLPLNIIADQLGVRREDSLAFKAGSDAMLAVTDRFTPKEKMLDYTRDIIAMQRLIGERIERVRATPDDTILGVVANLRVEGEWLSPRMAVNLFQNILVAGNETTTNALGNSLLYLLQNPTVGVRLRDNPHEVRAFVEEMLRLFAPLQGFFRTVTRDTELAGVTIPKGATVMLRWGAGGRDPALVDRPDELDLDRAQITRHMTFGHGVHFCIGNQLARAELRAAFEAIVVRWPDLRLADRDDAVVPLQAFFAHGLRELHVQTGTTGRPS